MKTKIVTIFDTLTPSSPVEEDWKKFNKKKVRKWLRDTMYSRDGWDIIRSKQQGVDVIVASAPNREVFIFMHVPQASCCEHED